MSEMKDIQKFMNTSRLLFMETFHKKPIGDKNFKAMNLYYNPT